MRRKHAPRKAHFNTSLLCWSTFCLSGCCPSQSEGSLLRTSRCRPGFLRLTGGPRPPRLHPRLDGRPLSRCAAPRQSDRCRPGLSASWRPIGSLSVQTGYRCRCVDCAARLHCRHQTAPIGRKERGVCSALLKWHNEVNIFKGIKLRDCSPLPYTHLHTPCLYWVFPLPGLPLHHHHPVPSHCRCRYRCLRRCWQIGVSPAPSLIQSQSPTLKHNKVEGLSYDPKFSSSVGCYRCQVKCMRLSCCSLLPITPLRTRNQPTCFLRVNTSTGC